MQRWLNTPPEDEGISLSTVAAAAQSNIHQPQKRNSDSFLDNSISDPSISSLSRDSSTDVLSFSINGHGYDSVSMSGISSANSASSNVSQASHGSWAGRKGRKRSKIEERSKNEGRRSRKHSKSQPGTCTFVCTWCRQRFRRKDSWKRHEESEHCPQKEYVCLLNGPTEMDAQGSPLCAFCRIPFPSEDHLREHRAQECYAKSENQRSFARLDSLDQHIRQMHSFSRSRTSLNTNKSQVWYRLIPFRQTQLICGFCPSRLTGWDERASHIADHFRNGNGKQC